MSEIWVLLLLILSAALPLILVFFWFRFRKSPVTMPWFLTALVAGMVSLLIAALIQSLIPPLSRTGQSEPFFAFFNVFLRIALVEELSRLVVFIPLFLAIKRRRNIDMAFCAAMGLVAGLGFAKLESAFYGLADINIALLRAITAAPLHGACSIRVAVAFFVFTRYPVKALFLFCFAALIHGAYNMMIITPALPSALGILVAFTALFSSLPFIKADNPISPPLTKD